MAKSKKVKVKELTSVQVQNLLKNLEVSRDSIPEIDDLWSLDYDKRDALQPQVDAREKIEEAIAELESMVDRVRLREESDKVVSFITSDQFTGKRPETTRALGVVIANHFPDLFESYERMEENGDDDDVETNLSEILSNLEEEIERKEKSSKRGKTQMSANSDDPDDEDEMTTF